MEQVGITLAPRYGDSSTPGGTHIFYTYQNLLPTLAAQVRSLMPEDEK